MSVRDVTTYRRVHGIPADRARHLARATRAAADRVGGQIEAHFREVEEEIRAAKELADAEEQLAVKRAALAQLETRRGRKL